MLAVASVLASVLTPPPFVTIFVFTVASTALLVYGLLALLAAGTYGSADRTADRATQDRAAFTADRMADTRAHATSDRTAKDRTVLIRISTPCQKQQRGCKHSQFHFHLL
jgi:hypothetical protein